MEGSAQNAISLI